MLELREKLLIPNGYQGAATVVALADTPRGYGCFADLTENAAGFTKLNLLIAEGCKELHGATPLRTSA